MWILKTLEDDPHTFRLLPGTIRTIGRATGADFIIDAALVSRVHCRLTAGESAIDVLDMESTNGTFVNGAKVTQASLSPGDTLRVGRVEISVQRDAH